MRIPHIFARQKPTEVKTADPATASAVFTEQAVTSLLQSLTRMPEVDDVLVQAGITRAALARLETDDEISAAIQQRKGALLATPWRLEGGKNDHRQWLDGVMRKHADAIIIGAWSSVLYGYSVMERVYTRDEEGKITLDRVPVKPLEWFDPRRDGTLRYFPDSGSDADGIEVDLVDKFLLTRHDPSYKQPKGQALLSRLYWPWLFRFNGWQFWAQFLERYGQPLTIGKSGSPDKLAPKLAQALQDAVIAVGREDEVSQLEPKSNGEAFQIMEATIVKRYQKLILGQTLTSDSGSTNGAGSGSLALGKVHQEVADQIRLADIRLVKPTVQNVIDALNRLNGAPLDITFVLEDEDDLATDRASRDQILYNQGVRFTKPYYESTYKLDESDFDLTEPLDLGQGGDGLGEDKPEEDKPEEDKPENPSKPPAQVKASRQEFTIPKLSDPKRFTKAQQLIEGVADAGVENAGSPIVADAIRTAIAESSSPYELEHRLANLLEGETRETFQNAIEQAMFSADIIGYARADGKVK